MTCGCQTNFIGERCETGMHLITSSVQCEKKILGSNLFYVMGGGIYCKHCGKFCIQFVCVVFKILVDEVITVLSQSELE